MCSYGDAVSAPADPETTPGSAGRAGAGADRADEPRRRPRATGRRSAVRFWTGLLALLLSVVAVSVLVIRPFVLEPFYIPSASMEPTLHGCPGCQPDRVLVEKLTYRFRDPERGEIVVFDRPSGAPAEDDRLIKRVIGLPGETVSGHDGSVWIGDRRLDEPYVNPNCNGTAAFDPITVPRGAYFVMGDNRCDSLDSRFFGPIAKSHLTGRAVLIVWPLSRVHWL